MHELMTELNATNVVKVTGSVADGTYQLESDIDFYVIPDKPNVALTKSNMRKVIAVLNKHRIKWDSFIPGYIFADKAENPKLDRQLEFSDMFRPRKGRQKTVVIYGVCFPTY